MHILEWLAGSLYLLNKIFFSVSERSRNRGKKTLARRWRIASWTAYLLGLPPWIVIFAYQHNWIAAGVEASGAPAMLLGLVLTIRGKEKKPPRFLNRLAFLCIPLGFGYSIHDFGGITTENQWLEIGLAVGFLVGTYLLAKERPSGYLWFILMHICAGRLMWTQGLPWLFLQQVASLAFIVDAYWATRKRMNK